MAFRLRKKVNYLEKSGKSKDKNRLHTLKYFNNIKERPCSRLWKTFAKKPIDSCEEPAEG